MLKQLPNESDSEFDDRLAAHASLVALSERAKGAVHEGRIPQPGAQRIVEAVGRLRAATSDGAPTWRLLSEVVGLAEALPPERSAKRVRVAMARKGGHASKGLKAREQHARIADSWKREVLARAEALRNAGVHQRHLVRQTSLCFPHYSERQVRRMLKAGSLLD